MILCLTDVLDLKNCHSILLKKATSQLLEGHLEPCFFPLLTVLIRDFKLLYYLKTLKCCFVLLTVDLFLSEHRCREGRSLQRFLSPVLSLA